MRRSEIRARMQTIIDFSELGDFIEEPVRTYSSGMYMRLAFAIATHVDPEILIVDEILAVGDDHFARKSLNKLLDFKRAGKTIVLVTHDLGSVQQWCDRAAWIDGGRVREQGDPRDVVDAYRRSVAATEMADKPGLADVGAERQEDALIAELAAEPQGPHPLTGPRVDKTKRYGNFAVELSSVDILDSKGKPRAVFDTEEGLSIVMRFVTREPVTDAVFGIALFGQNDLRVYGTNTEVDAVGLPQALPSEGTVKIHIDRLGLIDGDYTLDVAAHSSVGINYDYHRGLYSFAVRSVTRDVGVTRPAHHWEVASNLTRKASGQQDRSR